MATMCGVIAHLLLEKRNIVFMEAVLNIRSQFTVFSLGCVFVVFQEPPLLVVDLDQVDFNAGGLEEVPIGLVHVLCSSSSFVLFFFVVIMFF